MMVKLHNIYINFTSKGNIMKKTKKLVLTFTVALLSFNALSTELNSSESKPVVADFGSGSGMCSWLPPEFRFLCNKD